MKEGKGFGQLVAAAAEIGCELVAAGVTVSLQELMLRVETLSVDLRRLAGLQGVHIDDGSVDSVFQQLCVQVEYEGAPSPELKRIVGYHFSIIVLL